MAKHTFVSIVLLPPPDCARCKCVTYWKQTPRRFRPEGSGSYSGCRDLCGSCYYHLRRYDPDGLSAYPRRNRRCLDLRDEVEFLATQGVTEVVAAARILGIAPLSLERALYRARDMMARQGVAA